MTKSSSQVCNVKVSTVAQRYRHTNVKLSNSNISDDDDDEEEQEEGDLRRRGIKS